MVKLNVTQLPHLHGLYLAHPIMQDDSFKISILIGTDYDWDLVEDHIVRGNGPTAMSSKLGYLFSGPLSTEHSFTIQTNTLHVAAHHSMDCHLKQFWDLESMGSRPTLDTNIDKAFLMEYFRTYVNHQSDGSYCAKLPWNQITPTANQPWNLLEEGTLPCQPPCTDTSTTINTHDNIIIVQVKRGSLKKSLTLLTTQTRPYFRTGALSLAV